MKSRDVRVTAWYSRSELKHVYKDLYCMDTARQRHALGRLEVWRVRSLQKLSVSIESTSTLVAACVDYQEALAAGTVHEKHENLRNGHAIALIRFINCITETMQIHRFAVPVHVVAAKLGIPEWIVDLRHSATHGDLPALVLLNVGVKWALKWLKREFWIKQITGVADEEMEVDRGETGSEVKQLTDALMQYQQLRFSQMDGQVNADEKKTMACLLESIYELISDLRTEAVKLLSADGYLAATERQLRALKVDIEEMLCDAALGMNARLVQFWAPVLDVVHTCKMTPQLLQQLGATITPDCGLRNRLLTGWICHIVKELGRTGRPKAKKKRSTCIYKTPCEVPFQTLLEAVVTNPNQYTLYLTNLLIQKFPSIDLNKGQNILDLLKLYIGAEDCNQSVESEGIKTAEDLKALLGNTYTDDFEQVGSLESQFSNTDAFCSQHQSAWKPVHELIDWSHCPLGVLPGQTLSYRSLELLPEDDTGDSSDSELEEIEDFEIREEPCLVDIWAPEKMEEIRQQICVL
ncbi:hypothetical protein ScPMuIL_012795 [Solemya velum]